MRKFLYSKKHVLCHTVLMRYICRVKHWNIWQKLIAEPLPYTLTVQK